MLVIGTDAFSKILNWNDRRTCFFFGDGAGAVLLSATDGDDRRMSLPAGQRRQGQAAIQVPAGGTALPVDAEVLDKRLQHVHDGRAQGLGLRGQHRARGRSGRCSRSTSWRPATWTC